MTTRPKGRKFRIRRGFGAASASQSTDHASDAAPSAAPPAPSAEPVEHAQPRAAARGHQPDVQAPAAKDGSDAAAQAAEGEDVATAEPEAQGGAKDGAQHAQGPKVETDLEAIKAEGLSGRQLRMARRTALKHGITVVSDYDAVRQLRLRGIDPFARSNMLELIVSENAGAAAGAAAAAPGLPAKRATSDPALTPQTAATLPSGPLDEDSRAAEIMRVQRDIAQRRRRRLTLLAARLSFFVLLPTLLGAIYFYTIATPLYATHTEFKIDKNESSPAGGGGLGGLFGGTGLATATDSITVQSYLQSREAMLRLDEELGFREHFSDPEIDALTRLAPDATNEDMYRTYRRNLTIGYDPTEGIIRLEMRATDPLTSQAFSEALIGYAEERVDQMSLRVREDQMAGARDSYDDAEARMEQAQQRVLELQEQRGVLSTEAEVSTVFNQISTFELQLQEERLRLAELLSVGRPNETRVDVARQNISRLEEIIADLRAGLTDAGGDEVSLARISSELIVAQTDLETRQMILAQALQNMEAARIEATRQTLYLSIGVFPVPPDAPAYPKALENTLLTFFVFAGIYLLLSMTVAILREQVSS